MTRITTRTLAAAMLSIAALPALGVPAWPGAISQTQPDGSSVTLTLRGDEHFHYYTDDEGYVVSQASDGWFRIVDNAGKLTNMVPKPFAARTDAEKSLLMQINPVKAFENLKNTTIAHSPRMLKAPAMKKSNLTPSKWDNSDGHDLREIPTEGERPVLVILVNFSDLRWSFSDNPQAEMTAMLNEPGYSGNHCTGSAADYFKASSNGLYKPRFDVFGPVNLPHGYAYYGGNDQYGTDSHPWEMVTHACELLDPSVDFSIYDTNGDGIIDNVYVFYAGYGENEGVGADFVWPHSYDISYQMTPPTHDGVKLGHYACSNELTARKINNEVTHTGIGTFCHEFSHVLGLPDLYATSYTGAFTPGEYSVMDHGSYSNYSRTPPIYSIYEKYALEWEKPIDITDPVEINMQATVDGGKAYKITIDPSDPAEYYLFENRQQHSWDSYIPGHGMLVWHIDYDKNVWDSNIVNNTPTHQHVDLVEADGTQDDGSRGGDTFPGILTNGYFGPDAEGTYPKFTNWNGRPSQLPLSGIYEDNTGVVSFTAGTVTSSDSPLYIASPDLRLTKATDSSLSLTWDKVPDASSYYISVLSLKAEELFGTLEKEFVEGYEFKNIGDVTSFNVPGLKPGYSYQVSVYASSDKNLSAASTSHFSTFDTEFADITPVLSVNPGDTYAALSWLEVPGADHYLATVATRSMQENNESEIINFDNRKYPSDWTFTGIIDSREDFKGEATPSLRMTVQEAQLITGIYDKDISSISFWARTNKADAILSLKIYAVEPNSSLFLIKDINNIDGTPEGSKIQINDIPDGVRQFMMVYTFRTSGLTINIDDIEIKYAGTINDTPVAGYDNYRVDGTSLKAEGLASMSSYVAYIKANNGSNNSKTSKAVKFVTVDPAGIDGSISDNNAFTYADGVVRSTKPTSIYTLNGTPVALNAIGAVKLPSRGIYIIKSATHTAKIVW